MKRINEQNFFNVDATKLASKLIGKWIETNIDERKVIAQIIEVEAYCGVNDSACHTYQGKHTIKNNSMWQSNGTIYVYLCYGMHYMLNFVCGIDSPEAVLIRATTKSNGPGKTTKLLNITKQLNGTSVINSKQIALYDDGKKYSYSLKSRVGIDYSLPKDRDALLRYVLIQQ